MGKNATGTDVHVHHEGTTTVVHSGDPFPDGYEADKSLTTAVDVEEDDEVPGPGQFRVSKSPVEQNKEWKAWSVPELRKALGDGNYAEGDRKDVLIGLAITAGIDSSKGGS